ncbi:hypothetical protein SAMN05444143_10867 [Flavobacterium succinicans]|uniref:Uncharacterized protein n=1 Tax=Flavobacterium succinicans TaxID=29536 RepID=A0A1I4X6V9_9FLAO|nr:hypothetical protein SAMN05444143_10867 [Flavobacterium succinicans]
MYIWNLQFTYYFQNRLINIEFPLNGINAATPTKNLFEIQKGFFLLPHNQNKYFKSSYYFLKSYFCVYFKKLKTQCQILSKK